MFDYTHLLFTLTLTQTSTFFFQYQVSIEVVESKRDLENASKIIEVKANIEKSAKKKMKREKKFHRSKIKALVKGQKKELLNHNIDQKQLEEGHTAELKKIDELHMAERKASSILRIIIFLS